MSSQKELWTKIFSLGNAGGVLAKFASVLLSFLVSVILARVLGVTGYGIYAYVLALVTVLVIPSQFGMTLLVVRETAKGMAESRYGMVRGIWRWTFLGIVLMTVLVGGAVS